MATPSVTNIFVSGTTADSGQVNTNFQDLLNALTDGNNDLSIAALTCSGTTTLNGSVNLGNAGADDLSISASLASNIPIKTNDTYDFGSATLGLQNIFLGGTGGTTAIKGAASITTYTMTLPGTVGVAGQQLLNSGSGALEWIAGQMATVAKSAAYVITDIDKVRTVLHTTGASNFDVTLPTAADNTNRIITVKKVDSGVGIVTVKAAETIDGVAGATGILLYQQYEDITVQSDGTVYHVLSRLCKNKWQKKKLVVPESANVTDIGTNGDASNSGFEFNGMVVGKKYRLHIKAFFQQSGTSITETLSLAAIHGGVTIASASSRSDAYSVADVRGGTRSDLAIVKATATKITFNFGVNGTGTMSGDNTFTQTWVMLEELNDYEDETSDFT